MCEAKPLQLVPGSLHAGIELLYVTGLMLMGSWGQTELTAWLPCLEMLSELSHRHRGREIQTLSFALTGLHNSTTDPMWT